MLNAHFMRILLTGHLFFFMTAFAGTPSKTAVITCTGTLNHASRDYNFHKNNRLNPAMQYFVTGYNQENREKLQEIRKEKKASFRMMERILRKHKLPEQLKYLAVVESELNPSALSKAGALGLWQLMPETGRILGLTVNDSTDERKNALKSTRAAAIYLRDLHREFNDWLLVLAAYNCGPGPVYTAIKKSGSTNFWELQAYLPAESRQHVKKFIATQYFFEKQAFSLASQ